MNPAKENEELRARILDLHSQLSENLKSQSDLLQLSATVSKERDNLWSEKVKIENKLIRDRQR